MPVEPMAGPELFVFGRLRTGATLINAPAELNAIAQRQATDRPRIYGQLRPRVLPYAFPFAGLHDAGDVGGLHLMQGLAGALLVLVCLKLAILVYSRTAMRQGEIAVRTATGGKPWKNCRATFRRVAGAFSIICDGWCWFSRIDPAGNRRSDAPNGHRASFLDFLRFVVGSDGVGWGTELPGCGDRWRPTGSASHAGKGERGISRRRDKCVGPSVWDDMDNTDCGPGRVRDRSVVGGGIQRMGVDAVGVDRTGLRNHGVPDGESEVRSRAGRAHGSPSAAVGGGTTVNERGVFLAGSRG
jgi:hypothetical protein